VTSPPGSISSKARLFDLSATVTLTSILSRQGRGSPYYIEGILNPKPGREIPNRKQCQITKPKCQMIHPVVIARSPDESGRRSNLAEELQSVDIATHLPGARNDPSTLSLRGTTVPKQSQLMDAGDCHVPTNRCSQ